MAESPPPTPVERRILIAQALYAGGALLRAIHPCVSIAVIVLPQFTPAVAPRIRPLSRI